jgi:hypothetical protein
MKQIIQEIKLDLFRLFVLRPLLLVHDIRLALSDAFPSSMQAAKSDGDEPANNTDSK